MLRLLPEILSSDVQLSRFIQVSLFSFLRSLPSGSGMCQVTIFRLDHNRLNQHLFTSLAHFWVPITRTKCPDDAKAVRHQTCRKRNRLSWTKHKQSKFTSLTVSPVAATVERFILILNLPSVQLQRLQRIMRFDCALYGAAYFSQDTVPQRSGCTCLHLCLLRWPEA